MDLGWTAWINRGDRNGLKRYAILAVDFPSDGSRMVQLGGWAELVRRVGLEPDEQCDWFESRVLTEI